MEARYSSVLESTQWRSSNTSTSGRSRAPRSESARIASKTFRRRASGAMATTGLHAGEAVVQRCELALSADERREPALDGDFEPRAALAWPEHLERADRRVTLDLPLPEVQRLEVPADRLVRRLGHDHAPRARGLLHARREVRRVPDRGVVHPEIVADPAHDDWPS